MTDLIRLLDEDTEIIENATDVIPPMTIDFYIPDYNLAIQYVTLMKNSQGGDSVNFDSEGLLKITQACEDNGIHCLQIFENEWANPDKRNKWANVVVNKMRKNKHRVYARKLICKEILTQNEIIQSKKLFQDNHLQGGGALGSPRFGLFLNGELLSCMTFGMSRFHKEPVSELIRFATKKNMSIPGGASRLLKAYERAYKPDMIVSYANRRWSDGGLYRTLGFTQSHISEPNYFYFKPDEVPYGQLSSRNSYQKHKMPGHFPGVDMSLREHDIMFNHDFRRIYDCGNYAFIKTFTEKGKEDFKTLYKTQPGRQKDKDYAEIARLENLKKEKAKDAT